MKKYFILILTVFTSLFLTSCIYINDSTSVKVVFVSRMLDTYNIKTVAVLPMIPDDTTGSGTFFSTNHLYIILYDDYPSLGLANIDWIREYNDSIISEEIKNIKTLKRFDEDAFYNSDLGYNLLNEGVDAVLIGTIDTVENSDGIYLDLNTKSIQRGWVTSCSFTYFLVALNDGRILWAANCKSNAINPMTNYHIEEYPPFDAAISNGIDEMVELLPGEIFKREDE